MIKNLSPKWYYLIIILCVIAISLQLTGCIQSQHQERMEMLNAMHANGKVKEVIATDNSFRVETYKDAQ